MFLQCPENNKKLLIYKEAKKEKKKIHGPKEKQSILKPSLNGLDTGISRQGV